MITQTRSGWSGHITIIRRTSGGELAGIAVFPNLITDAGLDLLVAALAGGDAAITHLAWGDGTTAPANSDTELENELGRKSITSATAGATGVGTISTLLAPGEANVSIRELGWIHEDPIDGDTLIARVLYSRDKTSAESIQVDRTDTLARS